MNIYDVLVTQFWSKLCFSELIYEESFLLYRTVTAAVNEIWK